MTSRCRWTRSSCRKVRPTRQASCLRRRGATRLPACFLARKEKSTIKFAAFITSIKVSTLAPARRMLKILVTENSKAAHTDRRFLCPKLCETAPDDSYRGGIPRGSRTFNPRLNDLPRLSLLAEAPRTCMTSLAIPRRPIATLAAPRSRHSAQDRRYSSRQWVLFSGGLPLDENPLRIKQQTFFSIYNFV